MVHRVHVGNRIGNRIERHIQVEVTKTNNNASKKT